MLLFLPFVYTLADACSQAAEPVSIDYHPGINTMKEVEKILQADREITVTDKTTEKQRVVGASDDTGSFLKNMGSKMKDIGDDLHHDESASIKDVINGAADKVSAIKDSYKEKMSELGEQAKKMVDKKVDHKLNQGASLEERARKALGGIKGVVDRAEKVFFDSDGKATAVVEKEGPDVVVTREKSDVVVAEPEEVVVRKSHSDVDDGVVVHERPPGMIVTEEGPGVVVEKSPDVVVTEGDPGVVVEKSSDVVTEKSPSVVTEKSPSVVTEKSPSVTVTKETPEMITREKAPGIVVHEKNPDAVKQDPSTAAHDKGADAKSPDKNKTKTTLVKKMVDGKMTTTTTKEKIPADASGSAAPATASSPAAKKDTIVKENKTLPDGTKVTVEKHESPSNPPKADVHVSVGSLDELSSKINDLQSKLQKHQEMDKKMNVVCDDVYYPRIETIIYNLAGLDRDITKIRSLIK